MNSTPPNRNILERRIALVSIAVLTAVGMLLRPLTPITALLIAIVFGAGAFVLIKRKIFDARIAFSLCGVGMALVFGTLEAALNNMRGWQHSYIVIAAAYGFAALVVSEGFLKEFAGVTAEYQLGNRSRVYVLFLTSLIAFLVNAIIMSAGSTCAVVAPIFVPLLLRLGFPAPVAAAAVVLGAWGGFVNPADTGGGAITEAYRVNNLQMYSIPVKHLLPALLALVVTNITFAAMNWKEHQTTEPVVPSTDVQRKRTRGLQGVIAILPFLLFFPLEFFAWYLGWNVNVETRLLICLAVASVVASVVGLRKSRQGGKKVLPIGKVFFGGMWKGFAEVVLLIIAAKLFIFPFRSLIVMYGNEVMSAAPVLALASVPTAFLASAMIGSGDALATALIPGVVGLVVQSSLVYPGTVASMLWLATEMGRNVSPISAATLTCAKAATPEEIEGAIISRYVLGPLLVGFVVGCLALY